MHLQCVKNFKNVYFPKLLNFMKDILNVLKKKMKLKQNNL